MEDRASLSDIVALIESTIKEALDKEEKRLHQEKFFLEYLYERLAGKKVESQAVRDLAALHTVEMMRDLVPDLYAAVEAE